MVYIVGKATVWLDASTAKRALLAATFSKLLRERGYDTVITARSYDYIIKVLELLGEPYVVTGVYGGETLRGKLLADIGRILDLNVVIEDFKPKVLISYPSPPAVRVAFGYRIPYIALGDTPHGEAMNRLSYPLAKVAVFSEFIVNEMEKFILKGFTIIETFRGVDELTYIKPYTPSPENVKSLGLNPYSYVVLRPEEFKAHYYKPIEYSMVLKIAETLLTLGIRPVIIPRYREHAVKAKSIEGAYILEKPFVGLDLEYYSLAVVTGGISMAREAALLGVPGISLFTEVISIDRALASLGLPIYYVRSYDEAVYLLREIVRDPDKFRVKTKGIIDKLETPWPIVSKWVDRLVEESSIE
ncbi:MAG: DUF354 domain-containing protein [Acidilobaceae archaeon]